MQVNSTGVNTQKFTSKTEMTKEEYNKLIQTVTTLNDSFSSKHVNQENKDKKNILQIACSVVAAGLITFATGKSIGAKAASVFEVLPKATVKFIKKGTDLAKTMIDKYSGSEKKIIKSCANKAGKVFNALKKVYTKLQGEGTDIEKAKRVFVNLAGLAGSAIGTKNLVSVDGNDDGIKDIAQKSQNAYKASLEKIGAASDIIKIMS